MKKITVFICLWLYTLISWSQTQKIIAYFNRPVNNEVSTGINAVYLDKLFDDTLIAYINRAKYTIDMAIYSFNESEEVTSISEAINDAYSRGVAIRWIYNGSSSNQSIQLLNSNINTLASPTSGSYGLMHNKFMIIDANSNDSNEPTVWTGSTNWTTAQLNTDVNNIIIIQDKEVALAYTTEFNEMWGGTGLAPDIENSKFGRFKTDNTPHTFNVDGTTVEVYFSPSDGTNSKLQRAIGSANTDLYFGIYSFTNSSDADSIVNRIQQDVYTAGIIDPTSQSYPPFITLSPVMGDNLIKDKINGLYHNKILIVDPSNPDSDPLVFTGSHNWSANAETKNDENTVIIHNATIANIYYQSFYQNFTDEGGTLINFSDINSNSKPSDIAIYPNPCNEFTTIKINDPSIFNKTEIIMYDVIGKKVFPPISKNYNSFVIDTKQLSEGLYFLRINTFSAIEIKKLQVIK
ncbi:MAG: T9SS type A sorting domain-containing protein [Bacteroidetes bacterium]|nr:T9SS type A sorting domain-containing protein [Bacteroidota bacterium]